MIVPALLTDNKDNLAAMAQMCANFTNYVQVDIMDGQFVPSCSVTQADIEQWRPPVRLEAHLMVVDPLTWIKPFANIGTEKIIYHFEIDKNHGEIIENIKQRDIKVGIALNPSTPNEAFAHLVPEIDTVLFMSVEPGFYGAQFIPEVLDKIKQFKKINPKIEVGIDGGLKLSNVLSAKKAGADYICVGSAILNSENPRQAYDNFVNLVYG